MKKKIISTILSLTVLSAMITVPVSVKSEKLNLWKFDFGKEGSKPLSGYTLVTEDMHIINSENREYGFIGANPKDYRLHGGRIDGFIQQEGQVIDLVSGEGGIGSLGIKDKSVTEFNSGDYYPVRFALKVPDETYYKVKATVTTLDSSKGAIASLYTERKHPIFTKKEIGAGEEVTAEFTVRVTPVFYEKSDPKGLISDGYVSVCLLGENTALARLEIEQIDTAPTLWILGDSTVTDGGGSLPFFTLQNYTGVGCGVTKYLPENIAMVNEGEGGLSAHDNNHFNVVKDRIKTGDFLWVEYGHNHKSDGVDGYKGAIGKYYDICKKVGATLILVGPIDRINWYDANTNTWNSSLKGFSDAAKDFVDEKLKSNPDDKVAFVDLNEPSLKWFGEITKSGVVNGNKVTNDERLVHFYFQAPRGAKDVDHTHPNDAGAENLAYLFFENANAGTYPALTPLLVRYKSGKAEKPNLISDEIVNMGYPANDAWPSYSVGSSYEYPLVITRVNTNENNQIESLTCKLLDKNLLTSYAAGFVEINSVKYQTTIESHIDNSAANNGSLYTVEFAKDNLPEYEENFRAYMAGVDMADNDKPLENAVFSKDYAPQEIEAYIIPGPDGEAENFDYYGYNTLTGSGAWLFGGSGRYDFTLGTEKDGRTFTNVKSIPTTGGGSYSLNRPLQNLTGGIGESGRYLIQTDIKIEAGSEDGLVFKLANGWKNASPFVLGDTIVLFEVSGDGTVSNEGQMIGKLTEGKWGNVKCVLDTDAAVMIMSVDNGEEYIFELPYYQSFGTPDIQRMNNFVIGTTKSNANVNMKLSNLIGAKYNLYEHMKSTLTVTAENTAFGSVCIGDAGTTQKSCDAGEILTIVAQTTENGRFLGWYMDGKLYSARETVSLRMYTDASLVGVFDRQTPETDVIINYLDANGKIIKESELITVNDAGQSLHEEMAFALNNSYKNVIKIQGNENYDVYFFKGASAENIEHLGAKGTNVINLTFDYDGKYFEYEDFDSDGTWGFENEVFAENGILTLLSGVGTSKRISSVKNVESKISQAERLTVKFDWKSNVDTSKGRSSSFDLLDREGTYIFSLNAKGKNGLDYGVGQFADTVILSGGNGVNDWYRIVLTMDFENGILSGSITNKNTGSVVKINPTQITAKNLHMIRATYGYSSAPQQIDNFGFRDDSQKSVKHEIVKKEGTEVTVRIDGKKGDRLHIVASVFDENRLLGVVTKNVAITEDGLTEIEIDTDREGQVEISVLEI